MKGSEKPSVNPHPGSFSVSCQLLLGDLGASREGEGHLFRAPITHGNAGSEEEPLNKEIKLHRKDTWPEQFLSNKCCRQKLRPHAKAAAQRLYIWQIRGLAS